MSTKNYLTDFLNKMYSANYSHGVHWYSSEISVYHSLWFIVYLWIIEALWDSLIHYAQLKGMFHNCTNVCTLEVVQTEDSPVSIDFSLTVDLLVEFGHILVSIESNMNSMLDSYSLFVHFQTAVSKVWIMEWAWKNFLIELAMDSNQLVTLNSASVDFEFDELAIEYVLNKGFTER